MDKWGKLERRPGEGEKVVMRGSEGQKDACDLTALKGDRARGDVERGETGGRGYTEKTVLLENTIK